MADQANEALWYPPSIVDHEMRVGIVRAEFHGYLYVQIPDFQYTSANLNQDREQREREYRQWLFGGSVLGFQDWLRARKAGGQNAP